MLDPREVHVPIRVIGQVFSLALCHETNYATFTRFDTYSVNYAIYYYNL